jgi:hypothetical protein
MTAKNGGSYVMDERDKSDVKTFNEFQHDEAIPSVDDTSDHAVLVLLKRIKETNNRTEIRNITDRLQRVIFHKQYKNTGDTIATPSLRSSRQTL